MSIQRIRNNLGFLLAGGILFGVAINVYYEVSNTGAKTPECQSTLMQ